MIDLQVVLTVLFISFTLLMFGPVLIRIKKDIPDVIVKLFKNFVNCIKVDFIISNKKEKPTIGNLTFYNY